MSSVDAGHFPILHALRVKGLASDSVLAAMSGTPESDLSAALDPLIADGLVIRREGRVSGSMLTAAGKQRQAELLAAFAPNGDEKTAIDTFYAAFLPVNASFKGVCTAWQMRDETTPNDHSDDDYDQSVIADLDDIHRRISVQLQLVSESSQRFVHYERRLSGALDRLHGGDSTAFARPMNDSFHDVWMELHQDLLLTCGRERGEHDE